MDQVPPAERIVPARTRETVGDLALIVSGMLSQMGLLHMALRRLTAVVGMQPHDPAAVEDIVRSIQEIQQTLDERLDQQWRDLEGLLRRFAGEPDA